MRKFHIRANVSPGFCNPEAAEISGGFAFGARNAADAYAAEFLDGFTVCGGRLECYARGLWRFEAVNYTAQTGAILWVREL